MPLQLSLVLGDLTQQSVDAIVNAANRSLTGGGGVDGAIHRAAGPKLLEECRRLRRTDYPDGLPIGQAVATAGYELPARWVIHTVGPNWNRGQRDPAQLASCFTESLRVAGELGAATVAFPAVSAGAYGWDGQAVADLGVGAVRAAADGGIAGVESVTEVRFVVQNERLQAAFTRALDR